MAPINPYTKNMRTITEVHTAHPQLEEQYFQRMAHSMGDKVKLLAYLPPITTTNPSPRILDVGAGGGELTHTLTELGYTVTALDASEDAINRIQEKYPNTNTVFALANHGSDTLELETFDAIICSSILHEVYSYGDDEHGAGHESSLTRALTDLKTLLKTGGVLIIRDGVLPDNWETKGTITLLPGHEPSSVHTYLQMCPFANGTAYNHNNDTRIQLTETAPGTFTGNIRSLLEFAYTYTWGLNSYPRETQELYAVKTLTGYTQLLTQLGYTVTHTEKYLQPGYPKNLATKMTLNINNETNQWFDSNAIWIATKP